MKKALRDLLTTYSVLFIYQYVEDCCMYCNTPGFRCVLYVLVFVWNVSQSRQSESS